MPNRLNEATSPYLLQHADNPVDWWEWEPEAFDEARRRDLPVLLSVGYAACHWCHVMAHESFENPDTAAVMNAHFVNIKVDREERPDIDSVYMNALQAMTGQGGWPMTVFLTPDAEPFYAGTYYPPRPRYQQPSFLQVLAAIDDAWRNRRTELTASAADLVDRLREQGALPAGSLPDAAVLDAAVVKLADDFDPRDGGFGGAPKFPPSMSLIQLLRHHARTDDRSALDMATVTCRTMAHGGIYDQLAGGFSRYSVDANWRVPHFEKMLYDNALLLRAYTQFWLATGEPLARRVAGETADWLISDLRTDDGAFASSLDADTEGEEGKFYAFTPEELNEILGAEDGEWAASVFKVTEEGTFEKGSSVLQLNPELAADDAPRFKSVRDRLLAAREQRTHPARDDKVVAAWNGLAITGLVHAGMALDRPELVEVATSAANFLLSTHAVEGDGQLRLLRTSRAGEPGSNAGVLEDYGCVAAAFIAVFSATGHRRWYDAAGSLCDSILDHFSSTSEDGTRQFHDTADDAEQLLLRPADPSDNASPSGRSAAADALLEFAAISGQARYREAAEQALGIYAPLAGAYPRAAGWGLAVAEAMADGPKEIAIVLPREDGAVGSGGTSRPDEKAFSRAGRASDAGQPGGSASDRVNDLIRAAWRSGAGGVIAIGHEGDPDPVPLLQDRPVASGKPTVYVCQGFVCRQPTTDPAELSRLLGAGAEPT
ncbi:thioredoxin domain-containing protein [Saxibacter everestensis]|uniref:Thioredoxin domain-containing protein n=1 Tax=Saxibacter everestensis TaxID=2909229 RepID=A0ABY8QQP6_9MICO|nr:thioredoxin domain-containing protein [Brevibacteriaceae bacterium ZFBP1038]